MKRKIISKITNAIVIVMQFFVFFLLVPIMRYYFRPSKKFSSSMHALKRGSLIVANHQSALDPFIIVCNLPVKTFLNVFPIRFPTLHKHFVHFPFLWLVGAYDIGKTNRDRMLGLYKTRQYLIEGKSIMIFPEGGVCHKEEMLEFKKGVTFLTDVAANVIFVRMKGFHKEKWLKLINSGRSMIFGEVEDLSKKSSDIASLQKGLEQLA